MTISRISFFMPPTLVPAQATFAAFTTPRTTAGFVLVLDARRVRIALRPCRRRPSLAVNIANVT